MVTEEERTAMLERCRATHSFFTFREDREDNEAWLYEMLDAMVRHSKVNLLPVGNKPTLRVIK